jgi:hypothetical protein
MVRIAMWSGPRNLSTAMMYAFASRADTTASDEPFYAHYLATTGVRHPLASEVIAAGETDWRAVARHLTGPVPGGRQVWYQKHMCHHMLDHIDLGWTTRLKHCFLIRDPREVLLSLSAKTDAVDAWATGLPQQVRLVDRIEAQSGEPACIVDAGDVLNHPTQMLTALCTHVGIEFDPAMLSWPEGPKSCDGVWASHWYGGVWASTSFGAYRLRDGMLSAAARRALQEVSPLYERLAARRLQVS